jgi:hypothetical protein
MASVPRYPPLSRPLLTHSACAWLSFGDLVRTSLELRPTREFVIDFFLCQCVRLPRPNKDGDGGPRPQKSSPSTWRNKPTKC